METVADLLAREPHDGVAVVIEGDDGGAKEYAEETFYTTCHKTANLLNHLGLREGGAVVVSPRATPEGVFGFLGGAAVGARVRFDDGGAVDGDVLFCPADALGAYDVPASCRAVVYGTDGSAEGRAVSFEREIWGENPVFPDALRASDDAEVLDGLTAAGVVEEARRRIEERDLWNGDEVRIGTFDESAAVDTVAAVAARATVVLGGEG